MRFVFVLFAAAALCVSAEEKSENMDNEALLKWIRVVDEKLSHVSLEAPLREGFTPDYLANRTVAHVMARQVARFRSTVATAMIESAKDEARVCVPPHFSPDTVSMVKDELNALGFTAFYVVKDADWCIGDGVSIRVPAPSPTPPPAPQTDL